MDDLVYLKYANIQSLLTGSTTVTWRKIERVALFIDGGETVRTVTTMADITENLRTGGVPSLTASNATASTHTVDPSRGRIVHPQRSGRNGGQSGSIPSRHGGTKTPHSFRRHRIRP